VSSASVAANVSARAAAASSPDEDASLEAKLARTLRGQMPVLDALRGIAILLVLAHRFGISTDPVSLPARALAAVMDAGWIGVQLFFVLSGFLITGILIDTRGRQNYFRAFFARRALRIFPLYYGALAVAFLILPLAGIVLEGHEHQIWLWTYVSNWAAPFGKGVDSLSHFWSLAVEEQFYLAWPFVIRFTPHRRLPVVFGVMVAVAIASRVALHTGQFGSDFAYEATICRMDALVMGAAAAWALRAPKAARSIMHHDRLWLIGAGLVFAFGAAITHLYPRTGVMTQTVGYSILAFTCVVLLMLAVVSEARGRNGKKDAPWWLAPKPLRSFGKYSYALYVLHVPLYRVVGIPLRNWFGGQPHPSFSVSVLYFVIMTALTFACAVLSYHLYEKHFLRLKDRFTVPKAPA